MNKLKKLSYTLLIIGIIVMLSYFDLFSRYNLITAYYDMYTIGLVYPQCEFKGKELNKLNMISSEMGFRVRHVDCDIFYTYGMHQYYDIMTSKIKIKYGQNWLNELYEKNRN